MKQLKHSLQQIIDREGEVLTRSLTDGQLLENFIRDQAEESFSLLVQRHGSMVMGVCRRVLGHVQDAEDAFQATFLILLRKASSIHPRDQVGSWLYGVACRTAMRAKAQRNQRQFKEGRFSVRPDCEAREQRQRELREVIDQQLGLLPEKYRLPIVLCDLQGKSHLQASEQLGWAQGTFASRLFRGRQLLAQRLKKQGLVVTTVALSKLLTQETCASTVPSKLVAATLKGVQSVCSSSSSACSSRVVTLVEGVLRTMWIQRTKAVLTIGLTLGLTVGTLGVCVQRVLFAGRLSPTSSGKAKAAAPPARPPSKPKTNLQDLMKKRIELLKQIVRSEEKAYQFGQRSLSQVIRAKEELVRAQLELAATPQERLALYEQAVALAKELEKITEKLSKDGSVPTLDVLRAKAHRLQAEIALARARAK